MKCIKTLGLVAVTAIAAMAIAAPASATELTSPKGTTYTGNIAIENEGEIIFDNGAASYACSGSTGEGKVEEQGSTVTAKGKIAKWTLTGCNMETVVIKLGTVEIHTQEGSSNGNGTVTVSGTEVTTLGNSGLHCVYTTNGTSLGVLTGSNNTGGKAKLDLSGTVPRTAGKSGAFCGTSSVITGAYTVTSPSYLEVD